MHVGGVVVRVVEVKASRRSREMEVFPEEEGPEGKDWISLNKLHGFE